MGRFLEREMGSGKAFRADEQALECARAEDYLVMNAYVYFPFLNMRFTLFRSCG